jgi:hypothetical protein
VPQWCLTAPCVPPPVDNTLLFEVGAEFCADDAVDVAVRLTVPVDVADSAVVLVDDFDRDAGAVEDPDPPVIPPVGVALAELRTRC